MLLYNATYVMNSILSITFRRIASFWAKCSGI
jgi:hypothetical protein